ALVLRRPGRTARRRRHRAGRDRDLLASGRRAAVGGSRAAARVALDVFADVPGGVAVPVSVGAAQHRQRDDAGRLVLGAVGVVADWGGGGPVLPADAGRGAGVWHGAGGGGAVVGGVGPLDHAGAAAAADRVSAELPSRRLV